MPETVLVGLLMLAPLFAHRGELGDARRILALVPPGGSSQDLQVRAVWRVSEAAVLLAEGRPAEALAAGEEAYAARVEFGIRAPQVREGLVQALEAAFALGDLVTVERLLGDIEALRPGELTPYVQAQATRFGARLAARRGESQQVEPGFAAAGEQFRVLSMPFLRALTLLERGEWLAAHGRTPDAKPFLDEAREVFERLKARPWLERLGNVVSAKAEAGVEASSD